MDKELENIKIHIEMLLSDEMRAHAFADKTHDLHFQIFRVLGGYRLALEERNRALEAVEKLREACEKSRIAFIFLRAETIGSSTENGCKWIMENDPRPILEEIEDALAATDLTTVEPGTEGKP